MDRRPPLTPHGHVVVVTSYPPVGHGGGAFVMQNLLGRFDPRSFTVLGDSGFAMPGRSSGPPVVWRGVPPLLPRSRTKLFLSDVALRGASLVAAAVARATRPVAVVGVHPFLECLVVARRMSRAARVPLVAYLHDTIVEALDGSPLADLAARTQRGIFEEASAVLLMSEGMSDLYRRKYGRNDPPLEHSLPEPVAAQPPSAPGERSALFAGLIYEINVRAVGRVARACASIDLPLVLTTSSQMIPETLRPYAAILRQERRAARAEYLEMLRRQAVLVLALDRPEESRVHPDELSTIFPTKTPEYLASGRPIVVHCPEDYFLARFFRENDCGVVVSDEADLGDALRDAIARGADVERRARAGLRAALRFDPERLAERFRATITRAVEGASPRSRRQSAAVAP